jgi:hypothetical protein
MARVATGGAFRVIAGTLTIVWQRWSPPVERVRSSRSWRWTSATASLDQITIIKVPAAV